MNSLLQKNFSKHFLFQKILILTTFLSFFFFLWGADSWKFSFVGDEWDHYKFAESIVKKSFHVNIFSRDGVFSENPVLGSVYQAVFLKFFGISNLSWRLSNIILIFPLSLFFYLWLKNLFDQKVAFAGTLFLQTSFYLSNFFKIGYINPQALVLFVLTLYLLTKLYQSPSLKKAIIAGFFVGISFYIYIGPIFPLIFFPFLLPLLRMHLGYGKKILLFALMGLSYLTIIIPGVLDTLKHTNVLKKTVFEREFDGTYHIFLNVVNNFILYFKNHEVIYNHFVTGPYVDIITQVFIVFGFLLLVRNIKKQNTLLFFGLFISTAVWLGISSPYPYSPITRGIFLLPFGFALAGISASSLLRRCTSLSAFIFLIYIMVFLNVYQSQIGVFRDVSYTPDALLLKDLMKGKHEDRPISRLLFLSNNIGFNYNNIQTMREAYGIASFQEFHVLKSDTPTCRDIENTKVLIIKWDKKAKEILARLPCGFIKNIHPL